MTDGDLFGHRLGARLATTPTTMGYWSQGRAIIIVDKPEIPPEFEKLELLTTPKTYTIGNIYATKSLPERTAAFTLAEKYRDLLPTLYRGPCVRERDGFGGVVLDMRCGQYQLTIQIYSPDRQNPNGLYTVQIGLTMAKETRVGYDWQVLLDEEMDAVDKEGRQRRLEQARKDRSLRGFP
ncbi:hypothetical protein ASE31_08765 [Acidovorax sp. Root217]|nr:hypothetical protein ASE31_08765 [Acidovorax sp. Root217]